MCIKSVVSLATIRIDQRDDKEFGGIQYGLYCLIVFKIYEEVVCEIEAGFSGFPFTAMDAAIDKTGIFLGSILCVG